MQSKDYPYEIKLIRSRRSTLGLEIARAGEVIVRAPHATPKWRIERLLEERTSWIEFHLKQKLQEQKAANQEGILTPQEIEELMAMAAREISKKVAYYAKSMQVTYGRITIRKQKSRWGSCSRTGNLNFNCLLMLAPAQVIDYVVVHELSHRLEMNHSYRFWQQVEAVLPDYKTARAWLKEHGNTLMVRMHGTQL